MEWSREAFDGIPRLGWVPERQATPVTQLPALAERLGLSSLAVKRDDRVPALLGGTKPRKLDYLLAAPRFADAERWHAMGGIGSGNLVAVAAAAGRLQKRVCIHAFWEPLSPSVLDNLACTASGPSEIFFYRSRLTMALRRPRLLLSEVLGDVPIIKPGATTPRAVCGTIRGALELAAQVSAGELPAPDRVYVALGTGGTAVGLSIGFALAGLKTTVVAVAVVERALCSDRQMRRLQQATAAWLAQCDVVAPHGLPLPRIEFNRRHLGRGYAIATSESLAAVHAMRDVEIDLEPIYTGKAMAALFRDARAGRGGNVLFWHTAHAVPVPHQDDWPDQLPTALRRRLGPTAGIAVAGQGKSRSV